MAQTATVETVELELALRTLQADVSGAESAESTRIRRIQ